MASEVGDLDINGCILSPVSGTMMVKGRIAAMRRNRKSNAKKERIIMLASSALVLTALTMTGIYMQNKNEESKDNGYTLDFTAIEENAGNKNQEIAKGNTGNEKVNESAEQLLSGDSTGTSVTDNMEDDLDYLPMEAGSGNIEIPGLTDNLKTGRKVFEGLESPEKQTAKVEEEPEETETPAPEESMEKKETGSENVTIEKELHFAESDGLLRPLEGEVLIPFSMDSSVYFSTLDQYKYNPALMLVAEEGMPVSACAEGKVTDIFEDAEIGHAITMDLGDGYRITYGQLKEINVSLDSYVNPGETIGVVASPTKYYSVEGANLYLKLTMDDVPVNPEALFR